MKVPHGSWWFTEWPWILSESVVSKLWSRRMWRRTSFRSSFVSCFIQSAAHFFIRIVFFWLQVWLKVTRPNPPRSSYKSTSFIIIIIITGHRVMAIIRWLPYYRHRAGWSSFGGGRQCVHSLTRSRDRFMMSLVSPMKREPGLYFFFVGISLLVWGVCCLQSSQQYRPMSEGVFQIQS